MFFVTGCQRSGTTLLGMALEAHPNVFFVEENNKNFHCYANETLSLNLPKAMEITQKNGGCVGFKVPRDTHRMNEFFRSYPKLKIIWIARSPWQVIASMLNLVLGDVIWASNWAGREIRKYLARFDDAALRADYETAEAIPVARERNIAFAALCWRAKAQQLLQYQTENHLPILQVNYEDVVVSPESELRKILDFLDLEWHAYVVNHSDNLRKEERAGRNFTGRPIDQFSLDKWRSEFDDKETAIVRQFGDINRIMNKLGMSEAS